MAIAHLRATTYSGWFLWGYLGLVTFAELLTSLGWPQSGLLLHTVILIGVIIGAAFGLNDTERKLALALSLGPLIRILSLGLPLRSVPQIWWYPLVSIPLLLATWSIIHQLRIPRKTLGLHTGHLPLQLLLMGGGLGLGAIEHAILLPPLLNTTLTWQSLWMPAIVLTIFTGFTEEIIFRGLLQSLALPVLGRWALAYVAVLFAVLHIGYLSFADVVFVFSVGFLFAYIVYWGGSLLGVILAHGVTNTTLFFILPYLVRHPGHPLAPIFPWITIVASLGSLVAVAQLWWRAQADHQSSLWRAISSGQIVQSAISWMSSWVRVVTFRAALAFMIGTFFGLFISGIIFDLRRQSQATVAVSSPTPELAAGAGLQSPTPETVALAATPTHDADAALVIAVPTVTPLRPTASAGSQSAATATREASPAISNTPTGAATATPAPVPTVVIADLPWPEFLPDGLTLAVADSWPFQMLGPDQVGQPFLVFRDQQRWLVLRRQPASTLVVPASAGVQRLKVGEAPATLVTYADEGFTLTWEREGIPLQLSAVGLTVDDVVRVGARVQPQTPAQLQAHLAEAAPQAGIEVTALWPSSLPAGFAIVPAELSMEFSEPGNDASLAGYTVTFARGEARFQVGGGTLAPPQVAGTSERISAGNRSATLTSGQNRFLLTIEGTPGQLAFPIGTAAKLPLVQSGRVFVLADNLDRASFDRLVAGLLPVRPLEFVARASGQSTRELAYLWPDPLPAGYTLDLSSVRTSWQDFVLQGGRPFYQLSASTADGAVLTIQGGGDAYLVPEGADVEQVTARVHGQGATAVRTTEGVVVFWTEQGTFFTVKSSALGLDQAIAFAESLKSIRPSTFEERIQ